MARCKNLCDRIRQKPSTKNGSHYLNGYKYCRLCELWLITTKIFCHCCGMQLRVNGANKITRHVKGKAY